MKRAEDGYGCTDDLREALSRPELAELENASADSLDASGGARDAALDVAIAIGHCRLFGVEPVDFDGTLPLAVGVAAAQELCDRAAQWTRQADDLYKNWSAQDSFGKHDLCATLLERRMDAWAALVALDETHTLVVGEEHPCETFLAVWGRALECVDEFDEALQEQVETLSTVLDLPLVENWRKLLVAPYNAVLPWWLDGTLEAVDREIGEWAQQIVPGPDAWREWARRQKVTRPGAADNEPIQPTPRHRIVQLGQAAERGSDVPATQPAEVLKWEYESGEGPILVRLPVPYEADLEGGDELALKAFYASGPREEDPACEAVAGKMVRLMDLQETAFGLDATAWFSAAEFARQRDLIGDAPLSLTIDGVACEPQS